MVAFSSCSAIGAAKVTPHLLGFTSMFSIQSCAAGMLERNALSPNTLASGMDSANSCNSVSNCFASSTTAVELLLLPSIGPSSEQEAKSSTENTQDTAMIFLPVNTAGTILPACGCNTYESKRS